VDRLEGLADAVDTPIGRLPVAGGIDLTGLDVSDDVMSELFKVEASSWLAETELTGEYFTMFGDKVPAELHAELAAIKDRLQRS
jgi:phosphoenolpyruvate carboxykinase (GTP)